MLSILQLVDCRENMFCHVTVSNRGSDAREVRARANLQAAKLLSRWRRDPDSLSTPSTPNDLVWVHVTR